MSTRFPLAGGALGDSWNTHGQFIGQLTPDEGRGRLAKLEFTLVQLTVFLAPMNFLRHPAVFITLSDVIAMLCLLTMLIRRSFPLRPLGSFTAMWIGGAILFLGALLASSLFIGDAQRGVIITLQYMFSLVVLPFVLVGRPLGDVIRLCKLFVISIVLMCLFGIYLVEIDGTTNTRFVSGNGRMMSFVERENECASLIALTIPIVVWLRTSRHVTLLTATVAICIMVYGVLLTGSNTGLLAVVMSYCLYVLVNFSIWYAVFGSTFLGMAYYAILAWGQSFLPAIFQKRVLPALQSGDVQLAGTLSDRMQLFYESIDLAERTTWLGLGADQYRIFSFYDQVVHNTYMLIWTEGGIIAVSGLVITLLSGICIALVNFHVPSRKKASLAALSTVLVFALAINAVPHIYARFWFTPLFLSFALVLGAETKARFARTIRSTGNGRK